jgi:DNA-binding winged helix-turn-helix (wHTH) protein
VLGIPKTSALAKDAASAYASEVDRIVAFENGVDDVLACPFFERELVSRVRAITRRRERRTSGGRHEGELTVGHLAMDPGRRWVDVCGRRVALTPCEFALLFQLVPRRGRVMTRAELLPRHVPDRDLPKLRVVDTRVKAIRHELGRARACLETVRGVGYRFSAEALGVLEGAGRRGSGAAPSTPSDEGEGTGHLVPGGKEEGWPLPRSRDRPRESAQPFAPAWRRTATA